MTSIMGRRNARNTKTMIRRRFPTFVCSTMMVRMTIAGATVVLIVSVRHFLHTSSAAEIASKDGPPSTRTQGASSVITILPERRELHYENERDRGDHGVEYFFQVPPVQDDATTASMRGIVLLFHGCNHDGIDWFELPEERRILRSALLPRRFAVVSVSSKDRHGSRCWSNQFPPEDNPDVTRIVATLPALLREIQDGQQQLHPAQKLSVPLPLYAIGASSGGMFVPILHHALPLQGMSVMISPGNKAAWEALANTAERTQRHPPLLRIAFVFMPKDEHFAGQAQIDNVVQNVLSPIESLSVQVYRCYPIPVTVDLLMERIDGLTQAQAETIVNRLSSPPISMIAPATPDNSLNTQQFTNSLLTKDPRALWDEFIGEMLIHEESIRADRLLIESMREILNVAYAQHELTSEHMNDVVDFWLDEKLEIPFTINASI